jgi:hypothetical protein
MRTPSRSHIPMLMAMAITAAASAVPSQAQDLLDPVTRSADKAESHAGRVGTQRQITHERDGWPQLPNLSSPETGTGMSTVATSVACEG